MNGDLARAVAARYEASEWPALSDQIRRWSQAKPLSGVRVLDATPVYTNTLTKYLALQAGGAHVTVSTACGIPGDQAVIARLPSFDIAVTGSGAEGFDIVLDCAGTHSHVPSRFGYAELTRSGVVRYEGCSQPVVLVDSGHLKRIETTLGTGDGFVRAMTHLGHPVRPGQSVVVVGGGKVGTGVAMASARQGAVVTVVDVAPVSLPPGITWVDAANDEAAVGVLADAWCIVSATGRANSLTRCLPVVLASQALLANMGAEDEWGPAVPVGRVLNDKIAVNFVLAEPTRLRYLDPTLALSNAAAAELAAGRVPTGVHDPSPDLERAILTQVREHGAVALELDVLAAASPNPPVGAA